MKIKYSRFKEIIQEEMKRLKECSPNVDEELAGRVVDYVNRDSRYLQGYEEGEIDLERIAKECSMKVLQEMKERLMNEEQIAAVIEMLMNDTAFTNISNVSAPNLGGVYEEKELEEEKEEKE